MVTPSINITETDNGFLVTDNTDYSSQQIIGSYEFFDYTSGLPSLNTEYNTTIITVGAETVFDDFVAFHTDGSGNIHDAEVAYNHIIETVNEGDFTVKARLNKNSSTSFRVWQLEFYTFDNTKLGEVITVTSTLSPSVIVDLAGLNEITFRNLIIINPNEEYEDIGGVAQVNTVLFNYSKYVLDDVITMTFCDQTIEYTITNVETDCIIPDLVDLINNGVDGDNWYTLQAQMVGDDSMTITQTNIGNPFSMVTTYSDVALLNPFTEETTTPNTPSLVVPTLTSVDSYEFTEYERGGKFIVSLTIGDVCDSNTTTITYFSWVWDKKQLDCCFNKKLLAETCCAKTEEKILESSALRNVIYGIEVAERDNFDPEDIQKLIDFGWDQCDGCGCVNCK
tara:strand:- start:223 stop:1404 length:1182 start_codon:yes stop_codon:yes gene_type:complete